MCKFIHCPAHWATNFLLISILKSLKIRQRVYLSHALILLLKFWWSGSPQWGVIGFVCGEIFCICWSFWIVHNFLLARRLGVRVWRTGTRIRTWFSNGKNLVSELEELTKLSLSICHSVDFWWSETPLNCGSEAHFRINSTSSYASSLQNRDKTVLPVCLYGDQ
jgi:hypothetical protein